MWVGCGIYLRSTELDVLQHIVVYDLCTKIVNFTHNHALHTFANISITYMHSFLVESTLVSPHYLLSIFFDNIPGDGGAIITDDFL